MRSPNRPLVSTHNFGRRALMQGLGAAGLFAPFFEVLCGKSAQAGKGKKLKRLLIFGSMGTYPPIWTPKDVVAENNFSFSASTAPLAAIKEHVVLIEGLSSGNPGNNHGAPDSLTGVGHGGKPMISVDQYIADKLKGLGMARQIPSLLLSADSTAGGGRSLFNRDKNLPTIASPVSAYGTVFGAAGMPVSGAAADKLLKRKKSTLDLVKSEIAELQKVMGSQEKAKLQQHLDSLRQLETRLSQGSGGGDGKPVACKQGAAPAGAFSNPIMANLAHLDVAVGAFTCDITRVAGVQFGSDQTMNVDIPEIGLKGDQHGGFIHSGAPDFKNLIALEKWLAGQFVQVVNKLKMTPEADGSGSLLDNTLLLWARDMGDAPAHSQRNMRFVLASGTNGYLKTDPNGRYLKNAGGGADRHERVLLNACEALGITDFSGFGDSKQPDRTPIAGISG